MGGYHHRDRVKSGSQEPPLRSAVTRNEVDVSIIVIAHDVRNEVLRCLESVEQHAGPVAYETLLIDNGSNDGTAAAVAERFAATRIVRLTRNEGVAARNHGLRAAEGRLRMFLDSDAALTEGALEELVRFIDGRAEVGLVGPGLLYPDGSPQPSARRFPPVFLPLLRRPPLDRFLGDSAPVRRHLMADDALDRPREVEYVIGACALFTREAQEAVGELDDWMLYAPEDADWCFRIRSAGYKVALHPGASVIHDYRRSSARKPLSRIALHHLYGFIRFQWKWRRERRRLRSEGRAMDARDGRLSEPIRAEHPDYT